MAGLTRYLVNVSGTVTYSPTNTAIWSGSSGGPGGASVPGLDDIVIADAASGTGTVNRTHTAPLRILRLQPGASNPISWSGSQGLGVTDEFTVNANVTWPMTGALTLGGSSRTCTVNCAPIVFGSVSTSGSTGGTVRMLANLRTSAAFVHPGAALDLNGFTVTGQSVSLTGGSVAYGGGGFALSGSNQTVLTISSGVTQTGTPNITLLSGASTGTRSLLVTPTVPMAITIQSGSSDTVNLNSVVASSFNAAGFTGAISGTVTATGPVTLGSGSVTNLAINFAPGVGNTITQTLASVGAIGLNNGTLALTLTGSVNNLTLTGGTLSQQSAVTVNNTLRLAGGTPQRNGYALTCQTLDLATGAYTHGSGITNNAVLVSGGTYSFGAGVTLSGDVTVTAGTLATGGNTVRCANHSQSGGTVDFGTGGKIAFTGSLAVTGGGVTGTGSYEMTGAPSTGTRNLSGNAIARPVVVTGGTDTINASCSLVDLNTAGFGGTLAGTINLAGSAVLGAHDSPATFVATTAASSIVTSAGRSIGALSVGDNDTCLLGSNLRVDGLTALASGATLGVAGYTCQTGRFSGWTATSTANSTIAFGASGTGRLRVMDGGFDGTKGDDRVDTVINGETGLPYDIFVPGHAATIVTGIGTIELAGSASNSFAINAGSGSYAGITLNLATAVASTIATGGAVLGNITNTATGMQVLFSGAGAAATKVNALSLQQVLIGPAVPGVRQDLAYNGAGTIQLNNNLVTGINATPANTWFAQGLNGCIDGGNNAGIAFGPLYTGPRSDQPIYIGRRRFYT